MIPSPSLLNKLLENALAATRLEQRQNGSMSSLTSPNPLDFRGARRSMSVFPTAFIGCCLGQIDHPEAKTISGKTARYLAGQACRHGSLNYWQRDSADSKSTPYPDDLDDTACAWAAICQSAPSLLDGNVQAKLVRLLTATESTAGGPYGTWLVSHESADS